MNSMMEQNASRSFARFSAGAGALLLAAGLAHGQLDPVNALTDYEAAQGFELMFDGTNASSFRERFVNYQKNNNTNTNLHAGWNVNAALEDPDLPNVAFGSIVNGHANIDIRSTQQYRDFDWRFEFRNSGNQGVFYRFDVSGNYPWETGIEYGIDNNVTQTTQKFRAGAAYDLFAPSKQAYQVRNTNKWNKVRIVVKGDSVEHWMNDKRVVSFRYWSTAFQAAYQNSKWTAYNRYCQTAPDNRTYIPSGYIGLQGDHGGAWQIRRMRILHDSTASMDRVKFGEIDTTTTSLRSGTAPRGDLRLRATNGRLHVTSAAALQSIELRGLDGRLALRATPRANATEHSLDVRGLRRGIYLVTAASAKGVVHTRTVLQ